MTPSTCDFALLAYGAVALFLAIPGSPLYDHFDGAEVVAATALWPVMFVIVVAVGTVRLARRFTRQLKAP